MQLVLVWTHGDRNADLKQIYTILSAVFLSQVALNSKQHRFQRSKCRVILSEYRL